MPRDQLLWVLNEYNNFFNETAPMTRFHYSRRAGEATVDCAEGDQRVVGKASRHGAR
jgi:hypothetical protein